MLKDMPHTLVHVPTYALAIAVWLLGGENQIGRILVSVASKSFTRRLPNTRERRTCENQSGLRPGRVVLD